MACILQELSKARVAIRYTWRLLIGLQGASHPPLLYDGGPARLQICTLHGLFESFC